MELKLKINYNDLTETICDIINSSKSRLAKSRGYGVAMGLQILGNYLKDISKRAIKINDPVILKSLIEIGVIEGTQEEIDDILKRASEVILNEKES